MPKKDDEDGGKKNDKEGLHRQLDARCRHWEWNFRIVLFMVVEQEA